MKILMAVASLMISPIVLSNTNNLSDDLDKNTTQRSIEDQKNERINQSDAVDANNVPSFEEQREEDEKLENDAIQGDDPSKVYEKSDTEIDE